MTISRNLSKVGAKVDTDGSPVANLVTRDMLSPTAKNWSFLGQAILPNVTSNTGEFVRTPTVSWSGGFKQLIIEYYIGAYSAGAIGRIVFGTVANTTGILAGETTATCWCNLSEDNGVVQKTLTTAISGIPTAVSGNNGERFGILNVNNQAGKNKRICGVS